LISKNDTLPSILAVKISVNPTFLAVTVAPTLGIAGPPVPPNSTLTGSEFTTGVPLIPEIDS